MHELPNQLDLVSIQRHRIVRGNGDGDYTRQETTHISIQLSSVGDQNKIKKKTVQNASREIILMRNKICYTLKSGISIPIELRRLCVSVSRYITATN